MTIFLGFGLFLFGVIIVSPFMPSSKSELETTLDHIENCCCNDTMPLPWNDTLILVVGADDNMLPGTGPDCENLNYTQPIETIN